MMYPVLVKVRWEEFGHLFKLRDTYTQMGFSILANWVRHAICSQLRSSRLQKFADILTFVRHPSSPIRS